MAVFNTPEHGVRQKKGMRVQGELLHLHMKIIYDATLHVIIGAWRVVEFQLLNME